MATTDTETFLATLEREEDPRVTEETARLLQDPNVHEFTAWTQARRTVHQGTLESARTLFLG